VVVEEEGATVTQELENCQFASFPVSAQTVDCKMIEWSSSFCIVDFFFLFFPKDLGFGGFGIRS